MSSRGTGLTLMLGIISAFIAYILWTMAMGMDTKVDDITTILQNSASGSGNITISTTIQGNSVALGTDTTGDYVYRIASGTGVTVSSTSGEGAHPTISIAQSVGTSDHVRFHCLGLGTNASGNTGELRATGNITAYYSDERLKENITTIEDALEKVNSIRGVEFDWKADHIKSRGGEDGYFVRKHDVGILAQDVKKVCPEVVAEKEDGTLGVKYEKLIGLLVQAINELSAKVDK